jgi:hypothetical protein
MVKAKLSATNLDRYGDVNPSGKNSILLPALQDRMKRTGKSRAATAKRNNLKKYGETHPLKTKEGMDQYRRTMLENHGVTNAMHKPEVRAYHAERMQELTDSGVFKLAYKKVQETCLDLFGVDNIFKDVSFMRAARLDSTGYEYPLQDPKSLENFVSTCIRRYGTPHHMQNAKIFAKTMKAAHKLKFYEFKFRTKTFGLIGTYEIFVLRYLLTRYKPSDLTAGTSIEPLNLSYRSGVYFPDFYVKTMDAYIEVKSLYTLLGCEKYGYSLFVANRRKARSLFAQGVTVVWMVPNPTAGTICQLPQRWFEWTRRSLTKYISENQLEVSALSPDMFQCRLLHKDILPA